MQVYDHKTIDARLDWPGLIETLRRGLAAAQAEAPPRQVLTIPHPDGGEGHLLIMPAWQAGRAVGVKVVTFFPGNAARGQATINAGYLMFDGSDGRFVAAMDGDALTARRTAAASALAADYLARKDARVLLICGTGQLAAAAAQAHAAMRDYQQILIWGRSADKAAAIADALARAGLPARVCSDLEAGCRGADVISAVTASTRPFILGEWLAPGSHLDLIGGFKADMRECDDLAVTQARIFVDGRAGALLAGDLAQPIQAGLLDSSRIAGDLVELIQGRIAGRENKAERTVFKSAGMSQEDLLAAMRVAGL